MAKKKTNISNIVIKQDFVFSKNIDFDNTTYWKVCLEYFRLFISFKANQLNDDDVLTDLEVYLNDLWTYMEDNRPTPYSAFKKMNEPLILEDSIKVCGPLMYVSGILFVIFGLFSILTMSKTLLLIALVYLFVYGVSYVNHLRNKNC